MTREEAIKTLRELWRETNDSWYEETFNMAIKALSVDIVRCGECKHWYNDADTGTACEFTNMHEDADGYCSYGERSRR